MIPTLSSLAIFTLPAAGLLLVTGGIGLIVYSARATRDAVSRRINLVRDREPRAGAPAIEAEAPRLDGIGNAAQMQRAAIRLFGRIGIAAPRAAAALTASQLLTALLCAAAAPLARHHPLLADAPSMLAAAIGGAFLAGWFTPPFLLRRQIARRTRAVVEGMPDALELLVISVEAGLSFEDGIGRIATILRDTRPALADELSLTSADLRILPNRERALLNLAERVDAPSIRTVVTTLTQTMRYGTPLANALRMVSAELRNDFLIHLEERANQLPALMTVPMILFIMPTIFLIVGGPAVLKVIDSFGH